MSPATEARRGTADRLPRSPNPGNRGREIRLGVLGVLGIVALIVGIPVALAVFVGYPLPRSAPSKDWLTQGIDATLIIKILACVVWALWAHFTVCVIAEWRALRRGRLPGDVPFGGGSQLLARRLVAAALLLAGAAAAFGNVASDSTGTAPTTQATRHAVTSTQTPHLAAAAAAKAAARDADQAAAPTRRTATKSYVVQPSDGRNYDCLWDIAERTLGDPMRYKEIFALNKDRVQTDGRKLVDANLIRPGWQLRLPSDASGPGVQVSHGHGGTATTKTAAPTAGAGADAARDALRAGANSQAGAQDAALLGSGSSTTAAATSSAGSAGTPWESGLFGGGLMLAGIALALSSRRGPYGAADEDEQAMTMAADLGLAVSFDRALRNLAAARREQHRELPQPVLAWASNDDVTLANAGGDVGDPPAPWRLDADESSWSCRLAEMVDHPALAETSAPYPGLLSVGRDGGHELFVDFEQAPGLVGVGGDVNRARELLTGLAAQAVTSVWSDGATATLVGFGDGDQLSELDAHSIKQAASLSGVLDALERERDDSAQLQSILGIDGVLNGRQARRSRAWQPHFIVLSGPPTGDELHRLQELVGHSRSQFVVLVVGDSLQAGWRFAIDAGGRLDLGVLGATADAHRLDRRSMAQLVEMMRNAATVARASAEYVSLLAPQAALAGADGANSGEAVAAIDGGAFPAPAVRPHRPDAGQALATVSLLGPVTVTAPGPIEAAKRALATEIVVAIALHPDGIHEAVLRATIWPRGVSDDVFAATMRDVREWLGAGPGGQPGISEVDGRWVLGAGVRSDWEEMQLSVRSAVGEAELGVLLGAIAMFTGPAFSATPAGHYGWLAFARTARDARVLGTAVARRAATLLLAAHRDDDAEQALRQGLTLVPTAELLWRDLLELVSRRGPDPSVATAEKMYRTLEQHRVWAQPQTDALVAQLAPGYDGPKPAAAVAG